MTTIHIPRAQLDAIASGTVPPALRHGLPDFPLFADLDDSVLTEIARCGRRRQFMKDSTIHNHSEAADYVTVIVEGKVRTKFAEDPALTSTRRPGDVLDFSAVVRPTYAESAQAITDCVVLQFPKDKFLTLMKAYAQFAMNVAQAAVEASLGAKEHMAGRTGSSTFARLIKVLIMMAESEGTAEPGGWTRLDMPFTQAEIAGLIGAAREMVNTGFKRLSELGAWKKVDKRHMFNVELLRKTLREEPSRRAQ